jgi:outer membrane protein assembly factor BamB
MESAVKSLAAMVVTIATLAAGPAVGQDWSQWRGDHRDARVSEFSAPASWPKELNKKWEVTIGDGVATPSLVGDRLYVFSRQDEDEVARCLDAATGEELWKDSYPTEAPTGGPGAFPGPRCSPTVADGKVVMLGVRGILSCYDATSGKLLWRKDEFPGKLPMFFTSSSPVIVDGMCIAELGGANDGGIVAFDLTSGDEKWRWTGEGPSNGSPVLMAFGDTQVLIAPTDKSLVGLTVADGKEVWKIPYEQGRGTTATPIVDGQTLIVAGPGSGFTAIGLKMEDGQLKEQELWKNTDNSVRFNTPALKEGSLYGLSTTNALFCVNTDTHETSWSKPLGGAQPPAGGPFGPGGGRGPMGPGGPGGQGGGNGMRGEDRPADRTELTPPSRIAVRLVSTSGLLAQASEQPAAQSPGGENAQSQGDQPRRGDGPMGGGGGPGGRGRGGRGGRGGGGGGGYGSIVDAGSVLVALTPAMELVVFEPSATEFKELARYKVAESPTYAYPVLSGKRIFAKDKDKVVLWTVE